MVNNFKIYMTMTLQEIKAAYTELHDVQEASNKAYETKAEELRKAALRYQAIAARKMAERHRTRSKSYKNDIHWTSHIVGPILEEVERRTGIHFEHSGGTYGLRCEYPAFARDENGECIAYLCFTPGEKDSVFIDTGEKKGHYHDMSIGALNGMDNIEEEVTSIETVIENLRRRYPELHIAA